MNQRAILSSVCAVASLAAAGCTFPSSGEVVPRSQANQLQSALPGTVIKVRTVTLEGRRTNLGQYGGAVLGGAAAVPGGGVDNAGEALGVAAASVAGAVVGDAVEEFVTRGPAQEITVQLHTGEIVVVVQASPPDFKYGDEIHVIHGGGGARVVMARTI